MEAVKTVRAALAWPCLLLLLCACRTSGLGAPGASDPDAARAVIEELIRADNDSDLQGVLACYADDVVWLPPNEAAVRGKAAIRPRYEALFVAFEPQIELHVEEVVASDGFAAVRGVNGGWLRATDGGLDRPLNDSFLALLEFDGERWVVSHLMWNGRGASPPPAATE